MKPKKCQKFTFSDKTLITDIYLVLSAMPRHIFQRQRHSYAHLHHKTHIKSGKCQKYIKDKSYRARHEFTGDSALEYNCKVLYERFGTAFSRALTIQKMNMFNYFADTFAFKIWLNLILTCKQLVRNFLWKTSLIPNPVLLFEVQHHNNYVF